MLKLRPTSMIVSPLDESKDSDYSILIDPIISGETINDVVDVLLESYPFSHKKLFFTKSQLAISYRGKDNFGDDSDIKLVFKFNEELTHNDNLTLLNRGFDLVKYV